MPPVQARTMDCWLCLTLVVGLNQIWDVAVDSYRRFDFPSLATSRGRGRPRPYFSKFLLLPGHLKVHPALVIHFARGRQIDVREQNFA